MGPLALPVGRRRRARRRSGCCWSGPPTSRVGWGTAPGDEAAVACDLRPAGRHPARPRARRRARAGCSGPQQLLRAARRRCSHAGGPRPARSDSARCARRSTGATTLLDRGGAVAAAAARRSSSAGSGSTTVEGVARLAGLGGDVLALLESLAEQSLVTVEPAAEGLRHRLLEPVAQYARSRLVEAGEEQHAALAHAEHFLAIAEELSPALPRRRSGRRAGAGGCGAPQPDGLGGGAARGRRTARRPDACCWALWMYWWLRGHHVLGRRLSEAALDLGQAGSGPREGRARGRHRLLRDGRGRPRHVRTGRRPRDHTGGRPLGAGQRRRGHRPRGPRRRPTSPTRRVPLRARRVHAAAGAGEYGAWTTALVVDLERHGRRCCSAIPSDAVQEIARGAGVGPAAAVTGCRRTSRSTTCRRSSWRAADSRRRLRHLDEGTRLSRETSDHGQPRVPAGRARQCIEAQQGAHARVPLLIGAGQSIREATRVSYGYGYYRPDPQAIADAAARGARPSRRATGTTTRWTSAVRLDPHRGGRALARRAVQARLTRLAHHPYTS